MAGPYTQQILWTALPAGVQDGRLKITVFVSPRLFSNQAAPQLSNWPDWAKWPDAADQVRFEVHIGGKQIPNGQLVRPEHPDAAFWPEIIPGSVRITPYSYPNLQDQPVWSYPVMNVVKQVTDLYVKVGTTSPEDHPAVSSPLFAPLEPLHYDDKTGGTINSFQNQMKERQRKALPPAPPNPMVDFALVKVFFQPKNNIPVVIQTPDFDFHQAVSALGGHPRLLRRCGLAIDLLLPIGPGDVPANGSLRVIPTWNPAVPTKDQSPATQYEIGNHPDGTGEIVFCARPKGGGVPAKLGLLQLDKQNYDVLQFDPDGAAIKLTGLAETRHLAVSQHTELPSQKPLTVPSLRSAGLQVVRTGLSVDLVNSFADMKTLDTQAQANDPDVYLEDVTRGYALDIWDDEAGRWFSLCRRIATYSVHNGAQQFVEPDDEGYVSIGATSEPNGGFDLFVHEVLFRWGGWSLVAERPGKTYAPDETLMDPANEPIAPLRLLSHFEVPNGSLPRLRFGRRYRMRARLVDLAGNRLALNPQGGNFGATALVTYRRYEPIGYPTVVPRHALDARPAEKVDHLVIRSNYNETAANYAGQYGLHPDAERHVVPPRVAPDFAETHGMLDGPTVGLSKLAYDLIRSYQTELPVYADQNQLKMSYLADPFCRAATWRDLPGSKGANIYVNFKNGDQQWPGAQPFRIVITEGQHDVPKWDATNRTLTVNLEKSEIRTIRLSSRPEEGDLDKLGVWEMIRTGGGQGLKNTVVEGRHWMITPFRRLTLVHAVQQPLEPTTLDKADSGRAVGETGTTIRGQFVNHSKSTRKIDLRADWTEPIDDLSKPMWETIPGTAHVHEQSIVYPTDLEAKMVWTPFLAYQEFGDTKYRAIDYHAVATTRFREYLPITDADIEAGIKPITRAGDPTTIEVLSSARPAAPEVVYVIPAWRWDDAQTERGGATIRHTRHGGGLRVWLQRPWFSSGAGELLGVVLYPAGVNNNPKELHNRTTFWGNDPVWASTALPTMRPTYNDFANPAAPFEDQLVIAELSQYKVGVAGFAVEYDSTRELWYCDIEFKPTGSYWPFVRLSLARYQPKSINKLVKLSPLVQADYAQLAPDRTASVTPGRGGFTVGLSGHVYTSSAMGDGGTEVEAQLEHLAGPDQVDWVVLGNPVALRRQRVRAGQAPVWSGTLPNQAAPGGHPRRVVIREFERLPSDTGPMRRLIYADAIEV